MIEAQSELRLRRPASPNSARPLRHALASFLSALDVDPETAEDILMAVGEALANAVEHAYDGEAYGQIELYAHTCPEDSIGIDVTDRGTFIEREARPGRGFGLRIVRTVARSVTLDTNNGTRVSMLFDIASGPPQLAQA